MGEKFSKLDWLKKLAGAELTDGEYRALVAIFNHTNEAGRRCYAKQATLAQETGKSERQIRRIIPELIRKGWVTEVRKGAGRSGLSSEFDLSTPEYRTPMTGISEQATGEIPDTHDRYSEGIPDISGMNTGHLGHEYRTFRVEIPDTHVLPSDPVSDPVSKPDQIRGPVAPSDPFAEASIAPGDDRHREPVTEVSPDLGASTGRDTGDQPPEDRPEYEPEESVSSSAAVDATEVSPLTEEERDEILAEVQAEAEVWPSPTAGEVAIAVEATGRLTKRKPWEEIPAWDGLDSEPASPKPVAVGDFDPFAD